MSGIFTPEFVSAVVAIVVSLFIALVPQLESVRVELIAVVTVVVGLVIAVLGGERIAAARSSGQTSAERLSAKSESYKVPTVKSVQ